MSDLLLEMIQGCKLLFYPFLLYKVKACLKLYVGPVMILGHFVFCLSSPLSDPSNTKPLDARSIAARSKKELLESTLWKNNYFLVFIRIR